MSLIKPVTDSEFNFKVNALSEEKCLTPLHQIREYIRGARLHIFLESLEGADIAGRYNFHALGEFLYSIPDKSYRDMFEKEMVTDEEYSIIDAIECACGSSGFVYRAVRAELEGTGNANGNLLGSPELIESIEALTKVAGKAGPEGDRYILTPIYLIKDALGAPRRASYLYSIADKLLDLDLCDKRADMIERHMPCLKVITDNEEIIDAIINGNEHTQDITAKRKLERIIKLKPSAGMFTYEDSPEEILELLSKIL